MGLAHQVLAASDIEFVYEFAHRRLTEQIVDETVRTFASWEAKWRKEALEHYAKLGWSFTTRDENTRAIKGFFLGQPLLFFRGQTQTLWIEHIEADSDETANMLIEIAVKVAREKHLQRVLVSEYPKWKNYLSAWNPEPLEAGSIAVVKTTKG
ncbi:MAG: hypothetical protein V4692_10905 [Bdellovibrionota bacterium]